MSDHFMKGVMNVLYHGFNFVTGYDPVDPSPRSVAWRLIILESFAGVPGFVAAGFRHFYSTYAEARSRSHLHFPGGSRKRENAPSCMPQDVRSKSDH